MSDDCAQCNKIRALPWSPTKRDMMAEHTMLRVCQARPVEAPKDDEPPCRCGTKWYCIPHSMPGIEPAKPPESEALALIEQVLANPSDYLDSDDEEPIFRVFRTLKCLIEADAQRLKALNQELDNAREYQKGAEYNEGCVMADLAAMTERAEKAERERDEVQVQLESVRGLYREAAQARDSWANELAAVKADRLKWVKVCAERDNRIIELCNLMQRIRAYAKQHTQYPFATAIIDLCNQVLELR